MGEYKVCSMGCQEEDDEADKAVEALKKSATGEELKENILNAMVDGVSTSGGATKKRLICKRVGETPSIDEYKNRLRELLENTSDELLDSLDETLAKWKGREERLFYVVNKHGRQRSAESAAQGAHVQRFHDSQRAKAEARSLSEAQKAEAREATAVHVEVAADGSATFS